MKKIIYMLCFITICFFPFFKVKAVEVRTEEELINAINQGGDIEVKKSIDLTTPITINKDVNFKDSGYSLILNSNATLLTINSGNVNISNQLIAGETDTLGYVNGKAVVVNGGNVTFNGQEWEHRINSGFTALEINGGKVTLNKITDITSAKEDAIVVNNGELIINNSALYSNENGITINNNSKVTINDSIINGQNKAINLNQGNLTLGGTNEFGNSTNTIYISGKENTLTINDNFLYKYRENESNFSIYVDESVEKFKINQNRNFIKINNSKLEFKFCSLLKTDGGLMSNTLDEIDDTYCKTIDADAKADGPIYSNTLADCTQVTINDDKYVINNINNKCTPQFSLTVNHVDKITRQPVAENSSTTELKYLGDEYNTSPLNSNTTPQLPFFYKAPETPSNASGTINDNTVVTYEYEKIKGKVITTYVDKDTNQEIKENNVSTKEEETYRYGDNYETNKKTFDDYNFVNDTGNTSGVFNINEDNGIINVTYFYAKKQGTVTAKYIEEGTNVDLTQAVTNTYKYGQSYDTEQKSFDNYELVSNTGNCTGIVNKPSITVIYTYRKKDPKISAEITKTGTNKITNLTDAVNYEINYQGTVSDYIGQVTITITDKLPYKINVAESNLNGGTYNENDNTIIWNEQINTNSYEAKNIEIKKNITVKYININPSKRIMTNTAKQETSVPNKSINSESNFNTQIEITGKIIVKYIDDKTEKDLIDPLTTSNLVGQHYHTQAAEIEKYRLVKSPETEDYEYKVNDQIVVYRYEKLRVKVMTKVRSMGGTIKGDETVDYGNDSTPDNIKIEAEEGYVIEKVIINGEELEIPSEKESLTLSNFQEMDSDKLIEVVFKKKALVVNVPSTGSKTILNIIGLILLGGVGTVYYKRKINNKI